MPFHRPVRAVRVSIRTFVYGTEDEERVLNALLWCIGRAEEPAAKGKLTRSRVKAHFGGDIFLYEGVLKNPKDLRRFFDALRATPGIQDTLRDEFEARLDDDRVLHFRLDKQEAVQGRIAIG